MLLKAKMHVRGVLLATLSCSGLIMSGCGINDSNNQHNDTLNAQNKNEELGMLDINFSDELQTFHTHKRISNYTSKLAFELFKSLRGKKLDSPIAVSSFIDFDSDSQNSSTLGQLISENLLGQLHKQNIAVVDIHLMDALHINEKGTFAFNQEMEGYFYSESVKYVLAGFITQHAHGVAVNARIIQFNNQQILATASTLIPYYVADIYN